MAEQWIADPRVTGSNPVVPLLLVGVVGNISACHADARGSIPRRGVKKLEELETRWQSGLLRLFTKQLGFTHRGSNPLRVACCDMVV